MVKGGNQHDENHTQAQSFRLDECLKFFYTNKEMARVNAILDLRLSILLPLFLNSIVQSFQFQHGNPRNSVFLTLSASALGGESSSCDFRSPITKVYIEDTDAYGIMYNGNYLRSYDRALHLSVEALRQVEGNGWSIVSLGHQKFIASPALGADFIIQGSSKQQDDSSNLQTWDVKMTSPDGSTVFNVATELIICVPSKTNCTDNAFSLPPIEPFDVKETSSKVAIEQFVIHRDEIDAHWEGHLPLRNVLNLFERSRSNLLGGPDSLQRLKATDGILVVVTSISDCSLIDENASVYPGQEGVVETSFVIKRKGMIVECFQTLKSASGARLAQAKISLMMISDASRRPTSKLPTWLKQKLGF